MGTNCIANDKHSRVSQSFIELRVAKPKEIVLLYPMSTYERFKELVAFAVRGARLLGSDP